MSQATRSLIIGLIFVLISTAAVVGCDCSGPMEYRQHNTPSGF